MMTGKSKRLLGFAARACIVWIGVASCGGSPPLTELTTPVAPSASAIAATSAAPHAGAIPATSAAPHAGAIPETSPEAREAWLKVQFKLVRDGVKQDASKPTWETWKRALTEDFKPIKERTAKEVYWEHIALRYVGKVKTDAERNYSPDLRMYTNHGNFSGREGLIASAKVLNDLLPDTRYTEVDSIVQGDFAIERWGYHNAEANVMVLDGLDAFLITDGQIQVMMLNYKVEPADITYEVFLKRIGL